MIVRPIDFAHPPSAEERNHLERSESRTGNEQHVMSWGRIIRSRIWRADLFANQ